MTELLATLYVTTHGTSLHLDGDAIRIIHPDIHDRRLIPLIRIDHIVAWNGVTISNDLIHRCAADTRSITWITRNGRFLARTTGAAPANAHLRIAQYRAYDQPNHRLRIAAACVAGKLHNYRQLILRAAHDAPETRHRALHAAADKHATALTELPNATNLNHVLGIEGQAARDYFQTLNHLAPTTRTTGRSRQPPRDLINCLLSFGYAMLRIAVHGALEQVGLDPYLGYLHAIRPGKPALVLDLMEEFRALLVDRLVLTLINRHQITPQHTKELPGGAVELTDDGRTLFLQQWSQSRERTWHHAGLNRDIPAALLPLTQARLLARHLRHGSDAYLPWTLR